MLTILEYPDTTNPQFIDPLYIGNNSSGFQGRIKSLRDGNYQTLHSGTPPASVDSMMENVSSCLLYTSDAADE